MLRRITSYTLIVLFIALSYHKAINKHAHIVEGIVFQHSHANNNPSEQNHSHNKSELAFISIYDSLFFEEVSIKEIPTSLSQDYKRVVYNYLQEVPKRFTLLSNKSPPVC